MIIVLIYIVFLFGLIVGIPALIIKIKRDKESGRLKKEPLFGKQELNYEEREETHTRLISTTKRFLYMAKISQYSWPMVIITIILTVLLGVVPGLVEQFFDIPSFDYSGLADLMSGFTNVWLTFSFVATIWAVLAFLRMNYFSSLLGIKVEGLERMQEENDGYKSLSQAPRAANQILLNMGEEPIKVVYVKTIFVVIVVIQIISMIWTILN